MFLVFNSDLVRLISSAQQINPRYLPPPRRSIFCSFLILSGEIKSSNLVFQLRKREDKSSKQQFIERYQDTEMNIYSNKRKIVCVCEFARSKKFHSFQLTSSPTSHHHHRVFLIFILFNIALFFPIYGGSKFIKAFRLIRLDISLHISLCLFHLFSLAFYLPTSSLPFPH